MDEEDFGKMNRLVPLIGGTMITVALMVLIMSTSAEWKSDTGLFGPAAGFSPFFWILATTAAWSFSLLAGGVLTSLMARPASFFHGAMYGLIVWAAGYLIIGGLVLTMIRPLPFLGLQDEMPKLIWGGFLGDLVGMGVAVGAGMAGVALLRHAPGRARDRAPGRPEPEGKTIDPSAFGAGPGPLADSPI